MNGDIVQWIFLDYKNEEIDILTEDTTYTINNLYNLLLTVRTLTENNILISDTHTENVILDREKITIKVMKIKNRC